MERMIKIFSDLKELNDFAAEKIFEIGNQAIEKRGRFAIALAGGSTPKSLYQLLAGDDLQNKIDWRKVFFFLGDERDVPPEADESNFKMARESLFAPLKISDENIFRWQTELNTVAETAENYETAIINFFNLSDGAYPRFDLILLGMGEDGHTASLFPLTKALEENTKIAVANRVEKLQTTRLTLTFPVINAAQNVMFLVKGADKAAVLKSVLEGAPQPQQLPSQNVRLADGDLFWLVDAEAAAFLNR